jgi:hypothetical protein
LVPEENVMSKWSIVFGLAWIAFALRVGFAVSRGESFRDDLSLVAVIFFVMTVLLGSRAWGALVRPKATGAGAVS